MRGPGCALLLHLLLLLELAPQSAAEIPWGLPMVGKGPASIAKVLMAEMAGLKLENKQWPEGTHSLRYHYLALSEAGLGFPDFVAAGYVDDQPFIRYDSRVGRAQPQAPWMASMDAQYWETETTKHRSWVKAQEVEIRMLMGFYNRSSGTHNTHHMFGCDVQEDGRSNSFWHFAFDGQDHLSLDLETQSWVSATPMAVRTKAWWESEPCYAEYDKAYLESLCLTSLHRYLELGGQHLIRKEPPMVQVTRLGTQNGDATLRCLALGFYPRDISLSWWLGEEELVLETEHVELRPGGDGTYQTWAAVRVPAGEEAQYTCHVQHSGLNRTLTVAWEPPSPHVPIAVVHVLIAVVVPVFLLLLAVAVAVGIFHQKREQNMEETLRASPT